MFVKLFIANIILKKTRYHFNNLCNLCILQCHINIKLNTLMKENDFINKIENYLSTIQKILNKNNNK